VEVKDYDLFLRLSRVANSTLGTNDGSSSWGPATTNVKLLVKNENLIEARSQSIVNFTSDKQLDALMKKFNTEGMAFIDAALKRATEEYSHQFPDKTVSFVVKPDTSRDNVEYLSYNAHNPVRRAMYRVSCLVEVTEKDG
jgi:hypothetical protein